MNKRNLFDELAEGFQALGDAREGKITLRQHAVDIKPVPVVTADELVSLRQHLNLSRTVLAHYLRTNPRTLENWEQGRAKRSEEHTSELQSRGHIVCRLL